MNSLATLILTWVGCTVTLAQEVDFSNDIRPILADTCYKCHGPDAEERAAGLRLDQFEDGLDAVVESGDLGASELIERITSDDPDLLMPPPDSGRKLTEAQKELLKKWILQGATWNQHWSLIPPEKSDFPPAPDDNWTSSIDRFVHRKLTAVGLKPNPPADRHTLIRRVAFDLTGLPPNPELASKYAQSQAPDWYERLVDELLSMPEYGEHMARFWLDAARYGDTHGLHLDNYREMWLYRDWVIQSFNNNLPYRDFVIEQLAGDLLESPTDEQLIATGFNRAHVSTAEGGSIKEEVYVRNVVDRVSTTGVVFMGLTVGCAQCHDHKFDPVSQKEFYQLFAFFNNLDADPMDGNRKDHAPVLRKLDEAGKTKIAELERQVAALDKSRDAYFASIQYTDPTPEVTKQPEPTPTSPIEFNWVEDKVPAGGRPSGPWKVTPNDPGSPAGASYREVTTTGFVQHFFEGARPLRVQASDVMFAYVFLDPKNPPEEIMLQFNDGNWNHRGFWGKDTINFGKTGTPERLRFGDIPDTGKWIRLEIPVEKVGLGVGKTSLINGFAFSQQKGTIRWGRAGVVSKINQQPNTLSFAAWQRFLADFKNHGLPGKLGAIFKKPESDRTETEARDLLTYYLKNIHPEHSRKFEEFKTKRSDLQRQITATRNSYPTTLIWKERVSPKPAFVLNRGEYDQKGDVVERKTPAALPSFPEQFPRNRMGLAKWLLEPNHPLTARVAVNRIWQQFFGTGIVATAEDFGAQGSVPSHPELLDWLAVDFRESDWDIKRLVRSIVLSQTYRQSSRVDTTKLAQDPNNSLLSRGPRHRLDAEMLRDQVLSISGLLHRKIGGPSVKPPQPEGLWFAVGYSGSNTVRFKADKGRDKLYRRSVYTFWKRTSPPPQMSTFDAPSRESCSVRRERTNTPLQALLLMNETQYVESARHLATWSWNNKASDSSSRSSTTTGQQQNDSKDENQNADLIDQQIRRLVERALSRPASDKELIILREMYQKTLAEYRQHPELAKQLIAIGDTPAPTDIPAVDLAAWTMLASLLMNMDEFVNKN